MSEEVNILVIERDEGLRSFIADALSAEGYDVSDVEEGEAAVDLVREGDIDVVVCDIFLPGLNGIQVLKRVKQHDTGIEVVMTARGAPTQTIVKAMKLGAFDCMEKPIDPSRLALVVKKAVEKVRLARENQALKRISKMKRDQKPKMISSSAEMKEIIKMVDLVAPTDLTVLIEGESGVGKELVANLVHEKSGRARMPLVAINCGVLQENLLESELFGHMKGSFTGAISDTEGLFEVADKGTLFLDEIGEMGLDLQVKLLRVLETSEFRRVGGRKPIRVDVRILAATNRNLRDQVEDGEFREDLYYRLNVINIEVPPLRKRKGEIPDLVEAFVERNRLRGLPAKEFSDDAYEVLKAYHWPGNVRELENMVERVLILSQKDEVVPADFPSYILEKADADIPPQSPDLLADLDPNTSLKEVERLHIIRALRANEGNKVQTSKKLGINVKTLYNKIKRYDIDEAEILKDID